MATDLKSLTTTLSGAGQRIKSINARLGSPKQAIKKIALGQAEGEEKAAEGAGFWERVAGILKWGVWSDLIDLYKELVDAGIIKPAYEPPERMTEAEIRRIIAEALATEEKPLWQKVLPWAGIGTLAAIVTILLLKKK